MENASLSARISYRFDNLMARGAGALILILALISIVIILVSAVFMSITRTAPAGDNFINVLWSNLLSALDTGNIENYGGNKPAFLGALLVVTIGGIFVVSALIGVITTGLDAKIEELRRGRSIVLERGHTAILGWSPQIFTIISELVIANQNQKHPVIVILAEKDKPEMEEEIHSRIPDLGPTRIICRTGSPLDPTDLAIVQPSAARSIIILPPAVEDPDTHVIKTMLAITNASDRREKPYHVVTQVRHRKNLDVMRMIGRDEVQLILADDVIARITAQSCRQSGLSIVYTELLDFDGDEIYFQKEPSLTGKTFAEALVAYEESAVIGIFRPGTGALLNPPMNTLIEQEDQIIAVTEDDDTLVVSGRDSIPVQRDAIRHAELTDGGPEQTLVLGWNDLCLSIIEELDNYVPAGSRTTVVTEHPDSVESIPGLSQLLTRQALTLVTGDTTDRALLDRLDLAQVQHVIVLSDGNAEDPQEADARTLITLLHLRDIQDRNGLHFSIVSEMLDLRNRALAAVTRADDFVVSEQLVSLMMSQISENPHLNDVFADLFNADGSEIYLKPVELYVETGRPVSFYTVVESARERNEVALGYRIAADAERAAAGYGVTVNPKKWEEISFAPGDRVIVLAED